MGLGIVGFGNKFHKRKISIAEAKEKPLFGGRENKYISWYFDMEKSNT